jgi:polysaccharide biosynthesis protein PelA
MFDTLDSALDLERQDPKKYAGMRAAAVAMLQEIRAHYPTIKIMLNRGLEVAPELATTIDMLLLESTLTTVKDNKPIWLPSEEAKAYQEQVALIRKANPDLKIYSLDYWDVNDRAGVNRIYAEQRKQGYIPYVTLQDLMSVSHEPK